MDTCRRSPGAAATPDPQVHLGRARPWSLIKCRNLSMSNKAKAVVLLSGGMDSCVTAAIAARDYAIAALHASYGQRTETRELQCFHAIADHFQAAARLPVRLDYFPKIGGSSLTDSSLPVGDADL